MLSAYSFISNATSSLSPDFQVRSMERNPFASSFAVISFPFIHTRGMPSDQPGFLILKINEVGFCAVIINRVLFSSGKFVI
jgi:hypothetical protein